MKKERLLVPVLVAASSLSTAEIVINDFLAFEGFVEMSYRPFNAEANNLDLSEYDNNFTVDQVEISWLFDFDPVAAQIDLEYADADDATNVEQAFASYDLGHGAAITAGRYASMLGFEAFEPTGLYQYSVAYDLQIPETDTGIPNFDSDGNYELSVGDVTIIPRFAQGAKFTCETDTTFFGISLQDEVFDYDGDRLGGDDASGYGVEAAFSVAFGDGLSWFVGGAFEDSDEAAGDSYMLNTYVTYETGAWLFAAEANCGESEANAFAFGATLVDADDAITNGALLGGVATHEEAFQMLLMANYAFSDVVTITGRLSYIDHQYEAAGDDILEVEALKYTIAHGYAFTDNLVLVNELSYVDVEADTIIGEVDIVSLQFAVELIFAL